MSDESKIVWGILGIILLLALLSGPSDGYEDNCYDADPTQWTEMVCDP